MSCPVSRLSPGPTLAAPLWGLWMATAAMAATCASRSGATVPRTIGSAVTTARMTRSYDMEGAGSASDAEPAAAAASAAAAAGQGYLKRHRGRDERERARVAHSGLRPEPNAKALTRQVKKWRVIASSTRSRSGPGRASKAVANLSDSPPRSSSGQSSATPPSPTPVSRISSDGATTSLLMMSRATFSVSRRAASPRRLHACETKEGEVCEQAPRSILGVRETHVVM